MRFSKHGAHCGIRVLIALMLAPTFAVAQVDPIPGLLAPFTSPTLATRKSAFYALLNAAPPTSVATSSGSVIPTEVANLLAQYPNDAPQIVSALTDLLALEDSDATLGSAAATPDDEDDFDFHGDLVQAVTSLSQPSIIPSVAGAITSGGMATTNLASFGPAALPVVLPLVYSSDVLVRDAAAFTLSKMLQLAIYPPGLDQNSLSLVRAGLTIAIASFAPPSPYSYMQTPYIAALATTGSSPVYNTISGLTCNGLYNGTFNGNVTVTTGENCMILGGSITGNLTQTGGNVWLVGSTVGGNVHIQDGGTFTLSGPTSIHGNLQIQNLPSNPTQNLVCGITVNGDLQYQSSAPAIEIGGSVACPGNNVGGNLTVQSDTASTTVIGNTVGNNLTVQNNSGATTVNGNRLNGNLQDQSNTAPTTVYNNVIGSNLLCQQNTSITGGGNTAKQEQGQCAGF